MIRLDGGRPIEATPVHRFFASGKGLIPAGKLAAGDQLETLTGPVTITAIEPGASDATVHNLTVADFHTYFVGDGGAWVHNVKNEGTGDTTGDQGGTVSQIG
jgi:hypothetical protein